MRPDSYLIIPFVIAGGLYTGLLFPMIGPFLIDSGFEVAQIGAMVGGVLLASVFLGSITAARLVNKLGERKMMTLMMVGIVPFTLPITLLSYYDVKLSIPVAVIATFLPFYIMSVFYVVFVNLRLGYASLTQAGTDYSIGSAISRIGQTIAAAIGGIIAAAITWSGFYMVSAAFGLLAMGICWLLNDRLQKMIAERNAREEVA